MIMTVAPQSRLTEFVQSDPDEMRRLAREVNAKAGIEEDPTATIQLLREVQRVLGIRPEENAASRDLLRMRYTDGSDQE